MAVRLLALILSLAVALAGLALVRRRIPLERLQEQHEVAGVAYAVLAGLYGVILAFVLVMSWERFESMRHTIELEADALGNLRRHASAYAPADAAALEGAIVRYAESVVRDEWPAMGDGRPSEETWKRYSELWTTLLAVEPGSDRLNELWQSSLDQMNQLSTARRERMLVSTTEIPALVWGFLLLFGAVTVGFTYFFGMRSFLAQALITMALGGAIAGALILILETQTPFRGALNLAPSAFVQLLERAHAEGQAPGH